MRSRTRLPERAQREAASQDKGKAYFLDLAARQVGSLRDSGTPRVRRWHEQGGRTSQQCSTVLRHSGPRTGAHSFRRMAGRYPTASTCTPRTARPGEQAGAGAHAPRATGPTNLSRQPSNSRPCLRAWLAWIRDAGRVSAQPNGHTSAMSPTLLNRRSRSRSSTAETAATARFRNRLSLSGEPCVKNQRNGPCGGSHDGECEIPGRACIWARAYERLKAYGEDATMLDSPAGDRRHSPSAHECLGNTYLGRAREPAIARRVRVARSPSHGEQCRAAAFAGDR